MGVWFDYPLSLSFLYLKSLSSILFPVALQKIIQFYFESIHFHSSSGALYGDSSSLIGLNARLCPHLLPNHLPQSRGDSLGQPTLLLRIHNFHKVPPALSNHHLRHLPQCFCVAAPRINHRPEYVGSMCCRWKSCHYHNLSCEYTGFAVCFLFFSILVGTQYLHVWKCTETHTHTLSVSCHLSEVDSWHKEWQQCLFWCRQGQIQCPDSELEAPASWSHMITCRTDTALHLYIWCHIITLSLLSPFFQQCSARVMILEQYVGFD